MEEKAQAAFLYRKFKCIHWKISLKWSAYYFKLGNWKELGCGCLKL